MQESLSNPRLVALIVAAALFMELLDGTIVAVALPAMATSLGTDPVTLTVGITSYLLTLAVVIPASGWLADRFGVRMVFAAAITGFTIASLLCGMSGSLWQFTAARVLQGASAALMSPVGRLAVLATTARRDLMRAIAFITWPALLAPVVGPPLGGFITSTWSWRWIFFINLPIGLIGILLVLRYVPNRRGEKRRDFDLKGFLLTAAALASLISAAELAGHARVGWLVVVLLLAAGVVVGSRAIRHLKARGDRLIDLSAFKVETFAAAALHGGILFRMTGGAMPYLLPLFFQIGFGLDAFRAGVFVIAYALGNVAMKVVTTPVLRHWGFQRVLVVNGILAALSILACAALRPTTSVVIVAGILFAAGCFRSMQFTSLNTLMFADIADQQKSSATTISAMIQQLSTGLGVATAAAVLSVSSSLRGGDATSLALGDFEVAFVVIAAIALASMLRFFGLDPKAGAEVSGHRRRSG